MLPFVSELGARHVQAKFFEIELRLSVWGENNPIRAAETGSARDEKKSCMAVDHPVRLLQWESSMQARRAHDQTIATAFSQPAIKFYKIPMLILNPLWAKNSSSFPPSDFVTTQMISFLSTTMWETRKFQTNNWVSNCVSFAYRNSSGCFAEMIN